MAGAWGGVGGRSVRLQFLLVWWAQGGGRGLRRILSPGGAGTGEGGKQPEAQAAALGPAPCILPRFSARAPLSQNV